MKNIIKLFFLLIPINFVIGQAGSVKTTFDSIDHRSQSPIPDQFNYYKFKARAEKYLTKEIKSSEVNNEDIMQIERSLKFWKNRISSNGDIRNYFKSVSNQFQEKISSNNHSVTSVSCDDCNSTSFSANWSHIGPQSLSDQNLGRADAIWVNPSNVNHILIGAESGLWKTTNGGQSWNNLTDFCVPSVGVKAIAVQPNNANIIYIGTGYDNHVSHLNFYLSAGYGWGLYKSIDGGISWTKLNIGTAIPSVDNYCKKIIISSCNSLFNNIYCTLGSKVYKSKNFGLSWSQLLGSAFNITNSKLMDMELSKSSPSIDQIYVSTEDGKIWSFKSSCNTISGSNYSLESNLIPGYPSPANNPLICYANNSIYVGINNGSNYNIYKKAGLIWSTFTTTSGNWYTFEVSNNEAIYLGKIGLKKKKPSSSTFTSMPILHSDQRNIMVYQSSASSDFDIVFTCSDGGVGKSTNGCQNTTNINGQGLQLTSIYGISNSELFPNLIYCGTQDNGNFSNSTYAPGGWINNTSSDGYDAVVDNSNPLIAYFPQGVGKWSNSPLYKTTDGLQTKSVLPCPEVNPDNPSWCNCSYAPLFNTNLNQLYIGIQELYNLNSSTNTWTQITHNSVGGPQIVSFKISKDCNFAYVAYDTPTSWGDAVSPPSRRVYFITNLNSGTPIVNDITSGLDIVKWFPITDIVIDEYNPTQAWVTIGGIFDNSFHKRVWRYSGGTWAPIGNGLPNLSANSIEYFQQSSNELLFIGNDDGVYYKSHTMTSWLKFQCKLPNNIVTDLEINYSQRKLRASTYGRGIWETPIPIF